MKNRVCRIGQLSRKCWKIQKGKSISNGTTQLLDSIIRNWLLYKPTEDTYISNGSANLTERTLDDYNLEANLRVIAPNDSELLKDIDAYFNRLWTMKMRYTL